MTPNELVTRGFELAPWQQRAVEAWVAGDGNGPFRGTLEIFTGGGKTLIALECWMRALAERPNTRLSIVVPTEALAHQWVETIELYTMVSRGSNRTPWSGPEGQLGWTDRSGGNPQLGSRRSTSSRTRPPAAHAGG